MKTKLQTLLATVAPSICIETHWSHDKDCDGFENEDPDDWQAWQSEVRAEAVVNGEMVCGSAHLGGTWEKAEDHPSNSNPEISGYENQMTREALEDLLATVEKIHALNPSMQTGLELPRQIGEALAKLK